MLRPPRALTYPITLLTLVASTALVLSGCGDDETTGGSGGSGASGGNGGAGASGAGGAGGNEGGGGAAPNIQIEDLTDTVHAVNDDNGFLHLSCATDDDCFATLGYFHAQNRFFFMDFVRNLVRGRLASLVRAGDAVLSQDYENRRFFTTRDGDPLETELYNDASPEVQGHLAAYTKGVNAWLRDMREGKNGATLTTEYDYELIVKENIRDWEPEDSAAIGLYVLNDLSNNSAGEIAMAEELPAFDAWIAADLFSPRPVFNAFTTTGPEQPAPPTFPLPPATPAYAQPSLLHHAKANLALVGSGNTIRAPGETGSNNWVVGPNRTANGNALLANDPHLALTNPSIWFAVEIDAKSAGTGTYHMGGSTFPGLPAFLVGHNESIGWGVTTTYYDLADVYVEQLTPTGDSVVFGKSEVPIIEKEYAFEDSDSGQTLMQTFRWVPHHGPIVAEDPTSAITIKWVGHEGGTDLDAFFELGRAQDVDAAREKLAELASSAAQNFVVIDTDGNIGWFPYAKVPSRPFASNVLAPWLPLPGTGEAEWDGVIPPEDLPQLLNPASGVIATANQDMTGASADGDILNDGQDMLQAYAKAEGAREERIYQALEEGGNEHSVETMTAIQGDNYSLYGSVVVPAVLEAAAGADLTADEEAVVDALADWQFTCPTGVDGHDPADSPDVADAEEASESIGCTAFHATLYSIVAAALGDEIAAAGVELSSNRWDLHLVVRAIKDPQSVSSGEALWDDVSTGVVVETREDTLLKGLTTAASALSDIGAPNDWRWGRRHTLTLRSIFDNFGISTYNTEAFAAPGGQYTVNVANPRSRKVPNAGSKWNFQFSSGPSVRFVVEATPEGPRMVYQLPGGADLHRESKFYNNLLPNWLDNTPIEFPFGPGAVTNIDSEYDVTKAQ